MTSRAFEDGHVLHVSAIAVQASLVILNSGGPRCGYEISFIAHSAFNLIEHIVDRVPISNHTAVVDMLTDKKNLAQDDGKRISPVQTGLIDRTQLTLRKGSDCDCSHPVA